MKNAVDDFLEKLKHPHKDGIEELRRMILGLNKKITEEIKWNAPSFKLEDHFATFKVHPPRSIQLVLHTGAKVKDNKAFTIDDPDGLLKWPAKDRCLLTLESGAALKFQRASVRRILKQWVAQLNG